MVSSLGVGIFIDRRGGRDVAAGLSIRRTPYDSTTPANCPAPDLLTLLLLQIDKGILIVRFELPFNIWCGTCDAHIGAGVRYNAEKKKEGNYLSTPIYGFRCKCHLCSGWFEIRTDPKVRLIVV